MNKLRNYVLLIFILLIGCVPPASRRIDEYDTASYKGERKSIIYLAKKQVGVSYRYGGTNPHGFDCSGLVLYVYGKNGYKLPHSAREQYLKGEKLSLKSIRAGDLLFFHTSGRSISHVAIYIGKRRFVHAPGTGKTVRVDSMNNPYWRKVFVGSVSYLTK
jgi:murein DD-endopeptidase